MSKRRNRNPPAPFAQDLEEAEIRRQRQKARELRQSPWWKRKCDRGVCHWCGRSVAPDELTMDHIVPLTRGGRSVKGNLVTACKQCNNKKKQLLPMEWEQYLTAARGEDTEDRK